MNFTHGFKCGTSAIEIADHEKSCATTGVKRDFPIRPYVRENQINNMVYTFTSWRRAKRRTVKHNS